MKLVPVSNDDLALFESMFCDPVHMADLGGPQPVEQVKSFHIIHLHRFLTQYAPIF